MKLTKKFETTMMSYLSDLYDTYLNGGDMTFVIGGIVALLEYKLPKKQMKEVKMLLLDNFAANWLPYFFDKEEFVTTFMNYVFFGENWLEVNRGNDACDSFRGRPTTILPRKEMDEVYKYPFIESRKDGKNGRWYDNKKYNWKIIMADDCRDPKYGRNVADLTLKIRRPMTMGEFYQSSTVD